MKSKSHVFTDKLEFTKPIVLLIGRKKQMIDPPVRFEIEREHSVGISEETGTPFYVAGSPSREVYRLFLNDKLFSTTLPTGKRQSSVRIKKPLNGGPVEIHLVKIRSSRENR